MSKRISSSNLHPELKRPLIEPPGWADFAPLISRRLNSGFRVADVAAAMGVAYSRVASLESGGNPITKQTLARYGAALDRLAAVKP